MKTILLAAAAMLCIGVGVAYAESGDDEGGTIPNTFFTELPGVCHCGDTFQRQLTVPIATNCATGSAICWLGLRGITGNLNAAAGTVDDCQVESVKLHNRGDEAEAKPNSNRMTASV
jgi:hypothetical protein